MKGERIAVLYGGPSPEREISIRSGKAVAGALRKKGYDVVEIDVNENLPFILKESGVRKVFIALHGPMGEDGTVQGLLEVMGIPYTGSNVLGSALSMDKLRCKYILKANGIPTPDWIELRKGDLGKPEFPLPWVVKPSRAGSSIGVTIVKEEKNYKKSLDKAFEYSDEVIVERFVGKKEITTAVFDGEVLGTLEIRPKMEFYSYSAKYEKGASEYIIPPEISEEIKKKAENYAGKFYRLISLSGAARIDMRADDEEVYVLEANSIPGLTELSLLPMIARHRGINFEDLCEMMIERARTYLKMR